MVRLLRPQNRQHETLRNRATTGSQNCPRRRGGRRRRRQRAPAAQALLRELGTAAIPILRLDPGRTWIWSDLHFGDLAMVEAWNRPFRNLTHMTRALLAE